MVSTLHRARKPELDNISENAHSCLLFAAELLSVFYYTSSLTRCVKLANHYLYPAVLLLELRNFCIRREVIDSSSVKTVWEGSRRNCVRTIIRHPACAIESILHCAKQDKNRILLLTPDKRISNIYPKPIFLDPALALSTFTRTLL